MPFVSILFQVADRVFFQYDLLPDANQRFVNQPDEPIRVTHYGRVLDVYYVEFIKDPQWVFMIISYNVSANNDD